MPQMSPLWWTSLFSMFILLLMFMWLIMYFQMNYMIPMTENNQHKKMYNLNWLW